MPVVAIPFKSPPAFELPPHVVDGLRELPAAGAASQALSLLSQIDAADAQWVAFRDATGKLTPGPVDASDPMAKEALQRGLEALADAPAGEAMHRAVETGSALLLMGDLEAGDPAVPAPIASYLLGGEAKAPIGFLYVLPLLDASGTARGAMALHRPLAAGPLNHDQPAIAHALAAEIAARAQS